ncbi:hypothetical protein LHP98_08475 [Rhodobacter sp. Har01]|uniref:hypothetical protein n=1 Tax=Rhodobacter sp. Har01 TaxID=2883999 RepID=UPI001D07DE34|nr:hypothetical protein [Rhodobacter sp. Har01]MCB6178164.1 hypothetical protein [Rhodobacter sp. Har01]
MIRRSAPVVPVAPVALVALVALLGLAACTPSVPDSGGVGFQDYNSYIRNTYTPPPGATAAPAPGFDAASASAAIDRAEGKSTAAPVAAPTSTDKPRGGAPAGIKEESGEMIHAAPGISDENDFQAVASRETIESDKARIEQNRAQYVVVQPKDLPQRPGDTGPNIVEYALATTHNPGTQMHERFSIVKKDPLAACAKYASPDQAQQEFLARGGPDKDKLGLDPDGDGFACSWDPRPFRTALQ